MKMTNNAEAGELFRSPSGLLTRTAWEDELESSFDQMPRWYRSAAERDRRFARWVHAEAKGLACKAGVRPLGGQGKPVMAHLESARALADIRSAASAAASSQSSPGWHGMQDFPPGPGL